MNTEKQYEKLLETADKVAEVYNNENDTLTDDEVDKLIEALDSQEKDPSQDFPSNNGKIFNDNTDPSQNKTETVLVSANPVTGILNTIPYDEKEITEESIDNLINLKDEDLKKIEINWDNFTSSVESMYPEINMDDLKQLFSALTKYRQGVKFSYFNELPDIIKRNINDYVNLGAAEHQASQNTTKQIKNMLAKELFDTIISNNYTAKAFTDISKFSTEEIKREKEKLGESIGDYNNKLRKEYEEGFIKRAEEYEKSGEEEAINKAKQLRKVSRMFTQAYTYEDMYATFVDRKIKVKPIQLDKFKRTCQDFNRKYYNNTFNIKDVGMTVPVLDKVLDKKYDITTIQSFIVLFINYTKNFIPSNIDEHVFMFYFIQNILALEIKIPGKDYEDFNEIVKKNIYKFLDLIIERNNEKIELKKGMKK